MGPPILEISTSGLGHRLKSDDARAVENSGRQGTKRKGAGFNSGR